ncbi:MAG: VWA domain-containing protein [Gemmatimonadales bacterium]|jgi:Ca-activated chloride channel family protein
MKVNATLVILAAVAIAYTACTTSRMAPKDEEQRQDADPAAALPATPERLQEAEFQARSKAVGGLVVADALRNQLPGRYNPNFNTESYDHIRENSFLAVSTNPLSTFSIDVDRASYSNVRRFITQGQRPPVDAVRIEEMINYFWYDYPAPEDDHPFAITTEVARAPWNTLHRLVRIGIQGLQVDTDDLPPSNLVFLIDVSGSMQSPDKLPLLKSAFRMLVNELRPEDRVALVVYAGAAGLVLPSTSGDDKDKILDALLGLEAGGSTAGGAGIRLAYDVARENHIAGGNNRVILATDGDFNVGPSSDAEMVRLIEEKRKQGTFLTVLGFGTGNLQDSKMEKLADHGNGNFAYIDNLTEARKVLVEEIGGTLLTIAKDVKIQVEFNPTKVAAYRLIGYENRLLANEDFNDDTKDAGELGAGHSVTALYEVIPVGVDSPAQVQGVDSLRYQSGRDQRPQSDSDELLYVKLRYKDPDGAESKLLAHPVSDTSRAASRDLRFVSAVAGFGMLLRNSDHCGDLSLTDVIELAQGALGEDRGGYRAEFIRLVRAVLSMEMLRDTVAE